MIQHIVALSLRPAAEEDTLYAIMKKLEALRSGIPGFTALHHGPNLDFERLSQRYSYGFVCTFTDKAALVAYVRDPRHKALATQLISLCEPGPGGILVFDLET